MNVKPDAPLKSIGQITSSIAEALQISDLSSADPTSFWRDVATALTQTYDGESAPEIAMWLFAEFDREWDPDEALDEATGLPAVSAYEEILEIANRLEQPRLYDQALPEDIIAGDEEEEAGSDALAELSEDIGFSTADLGLETVLSNIHRGNLVISPEWQRSYVWKSKRKKRFIESLLINLPIPSILTWLDNKSQTEYVIDGRQRLETLVRFCSTREQLELLQIDEKPFKTFSSKEALFAPPRGQLRELANKRFDQFPQSWKERLYRQTFRIIRFNRLTRPQLYQVFERYNTGGVQLQAQEIRNAVFQNSLLHKHLWNLAREYAEPKPEPDADIDRVSHDLRARMDRKADRYGVYSFLGRVMAFTYFHAGRNHPPRGFQPNYTATVASATNDFMEDYENLEWEELRAKWIRMYEKTVDWYTNDLALVRPTASKVPFHAFLATVQLATTPHLLEHIDTGLVTEDAVKSAIRSSWRDFALKEPDADQAGRAGIVYEKQNSTLFWSAQRRWLDLLRSQLGLRDTNTARQ